MSDIVSDIVLTDAILKSISDGVARALPGEWVYLSHARAILEAAVASQPFRAAIVRDVVEKGPKNPKLHAAASAMSSAERGAWGLGYATATSDILAALLPALPTAEARK